jgi:methylmalonyl-CoA mutase cobalamin-binding subunit
MLCQGQNAAVELAMSDHMGNGTIYERGERADISVLASHVISALSERSDEAIRSVRESLVRKLVNATMLQVGYDPEMLLNDLTGSRVSAEQIVDVYIPEAARLLGDMWLDDDIGFAQVTIASARLQGLLTLLSPLWSNKASSHIIDHNLLMILQSNDTHTLGAHVTTSQLRRMGASVRILFAPEADKVARILSDERYDLVMFSCSRAYALASISETVKRIRADCKDVPPMVLGGLVQDHADQVMERTGVDLVTSDVKAAFKLCEKRRTKVRSVAL